MNEMNKKNRCVSSHQREMEVAVKKVNQKHVRLLHDRRIVHWQK